MEAELPSTSGKCVDDPIPFHKAAAYNSFGKASICSSFSNKSGGSSSTTATAGKENLDSLLKTIAKDAHNSLNIHESVNDVNSIK